MTFLWIVEGSLNSTGNTIRTHLLQHLCRKLLHNKYLLHKSWLFNFCSTFLDSTSQQAKNIQDTPQNRLDHQMLQQKEPAFPPASNTRNDHMADLELDLNGGSKGSRRKNKEHTKNVSFKEESKKSHKPPKMAPEKKSKVKKEDSGGDDSMDDEDEDDYDSNSDDSHDLNKGNSDKGAGFSKDML